MKEVFLQIWEETILKSDSRPDGCSLHLNLEMCIKYLNSIYSNRDNDIPIAYETAIGKPIKVLVTDQLFNIIINDNIRLLQNEFNNLLQLEDIIYDE